MDVLNALFEQHFHRPPTRVVQLQGELGGSGRKIIRLSDGQQSAIGILHDVREENAAFLAFSPPLSAAMACRSRKSMARISTKAPTSNEDLGNTTLFDFLSSNRAGRRHRAGGIDAYRKVVAVLPRFQVEAGRDLDYRSAIRAAASTASPSRGT